MADQLETRVEDLEDEKKELEQELDSIKKRNKSVEVDKEWETSKTRRILISLFTYLAISLYLNAINISRPGLMP